MAARRVFLGWDGPFLERAADWLAAELGADQSAHVLVLPGRRAARRLEDLLARRCGAAWLPPRFATAGDLPRLLCAEPPPQASQLARELAWTAALQGLEPAELQRLCARPPEDRAGWRLLARRLARADESLASEGLDFAAVAELQGAPFGEAERARWRALAAAQRARDALLDGAGLVDPAHAARRALGCPPAGARVVLVAPSELGKAQRDLLDALAAQLTVLVFAPQEHEALFDGHGLPRAGWSERDLPLALEAWQVFEDPEDLARGAVRWLAERAARGTLAPEEVTLGVLREELAPPLERALRAAGVEPRLAAGLPLERTPPARLLAASAQWLAGRSFAAFAALVRHPGVEAALAPRLGGLDPAAACDAYAALHLPLAVAATWPGEDAALREPVERLAAALAQLLAPLDTPEPRPAHAWAEPVRAVLAAVWPQAERDPARAAAWNLAGALEGLGAALGELEDLERAPLEPRLTAAEALELLHARVCGERVAPPPRAGAVELLGWLELLLDDAPALFVAGFDEGSVPRPLPADGLLPDALRRQLGLDDDARRLAREAYTAHAILASRPGCVLASARRTAAGDPLRPSRLAFHRPAEEAPARVLRFFEPSAQAARAAPREERAWRKPILDSPPPERLWVSDFKAYLDSPYAFHVQRLLRRESAGEPEPELDPRAFGELAHALLQELAGSPLRASTDAGAIHAWLSRALDARLARTFGPAPQPAVRLQAEQLRWRFEGFAEWQARNAAEGWRIEHVERPGELALDVDGTTVRVVGRIDRIDRHPRLGWRVLDYKTGDEARDPRTCRGRDGWRDLQLPLYREMVRDLCGAEPVQLGYVALPRDREDCGVRLARWSEDELRAAMEEAREVVRKIRRGAFDDVGDLPRRAKREPLLAALAGLQLLEAAEEGDEGDGAEEAP